MGRQHSTRSNARFEDVAEVPMKYYLGVILSPTVDNALRAMYLDRQPWESKGKGLRGDNASTASKVISVKWRKPNRHLPTNFRELKEGEAFELE
jgi:hypothetical protein